MKRYLNLIFFTATCFLSSLVYAQSDTVKWYTKVPSGYLLVLHQGDSILNRLEELVIKEKIPSANFTGMGFVNMKFGFFNFKTKAYKPKLFNDVELTSMHGTIAWQNGKVSIHSHGTVTDRRFKAYGGHILSGAVATGSLEILVTVHDKAFERRYDEQLGANVLDLDEP